MKFEKYNSLENHYRQKFIDKVTYEGLSEGAFVATEKVHGANYSFWYDGVTLKRAKRSGFIGDEEVFFSDNRLESNHNKVKTLYLNMLKDGLIKVGDTVVVYGEIFGGNYFGESEPNAKQVQGGMDYHPDTKFLAFDIKVLSLYGEERWLDYSSFFVLCQDAEIKTTPVLKIGQLGDVLATDNDFPSLVPALYGLTPPQGKVSVCEGYVVRPAFGERFLSNGSRVIIKSKNSRFQEKAGRAVKVAESVLLSPESKAILENFTTYLVPARVAAVVSKEGEVTWKDIAMLTGKTYQDAIEDYNLDEGVNLKTVLDKEWKVFTRFAQKVTMDVVRQHLKTII